MGPHFLSVPTLPRALVHAQGSKLTPVAVPVPRPGAYRVYPHKLWTRDLPVAVTAQICGYSVLPWHE